MRYEDKMTLGEARKLLRENIDKGMECPCCTQTTKRYSRPITSSMAAGLILFSNRSKLNNDWIHAESFFKKLDIPSTIRGDFSKLRFWGLIAASDQLDGYYKITSKGLEFVAGQVKVERNVLVFNNKSYGFQGAYVGIKDCLKNKFDFNKLMKGIL